MNRNKLHNQPRTSTCEICGAVIDISTTGWMETDTGDVCAQCVRDAEE